MKTIVLFCAVALLGRFTDEGAVCRKHSRFGCATPRAPRSKAPRCRFRIPCLTIPRARKQIAIGNFVLANIPYNNYHVSAVAPGFESGEQDADVRSSIALDVKISLKIGPLLKAVTVVAAGTSRSKTDPTTHTDVDRNLFDKLPLESQSSSLSSLVNASFARRFRGLQRSVFKDSAITRKNSFSVDGQPITDQQSKVFPISFRLMRCSPWRVIEGAPPADMVTRPAW